MSTMTRLQQELGLRLLYGARATAATLPAPEPGRFLCLNYATGNWYNGDLEFWAGFLAAKFRLLWDLYRDESLAMAARRVTAQVLPISEVANIDTGFALYYAACLGYEATGEPAYKEAALQGAQAFARLFDPSLGVFLIRPVDGPEDPRLTAFYEPFCPRETLVDTGATLNLLWWAARYEPRFGELARTHMRRCVELGVIDGEGRAYHALNFDAGGKPGSVHTHQGLRRDSRWTRAQAWGLAGYLSAYEATGETFFAETAVRAAGWLKRQIPPHRIPLFDLDAPDMVQTPRDSCTAAIALTALTRMRYLGLQQPDDAEWMARTSAALVRDAVTPAGLVLHGSWGAHKGPAVESVMPYGNYFITEFHYRQVSAEAPLLRLKRP